jgi:hypothetical protein
VKKLIIIAIGGLYCFHAQAISIVYNMRIASITRRQHANVPGNEAHALLETPFGQWRALKDGTKQHDAGILNSYIYSQASGYIKVDTAVAHIVSDIPVPARNKTLHIARTQWDDLLFTGGYGQKLGSKGRITYTGLFGIPLHRDYILELAQFGTGHIGIGGQVDSSYMLTDHETMFFALRGIYFVPRHARVDNPCLQSAYEQSMYDIKLGTVFDIFISHQTMWNTYNRLEYGYDATFAVGGSINPPVTNGVTFTRHSFFGVYFRTVPVFGKLTGLIIGLSGGFDSKPECLGNRYHATLWGSWGFAF